MDSPLVSIVCLCYNQEKFIQETLESVVSQTYENIEIIIIDDCSKDDSVNVIKSFVNQYSNFDITTIFLPENLGNCAAFNSGLAIAGGKYIIDLSCDDVLLPNKINDQVAFFETLNDTVGLIYSNTDYIDSTSNIIRTHFNSKNKLTPYSGDIYSKVIAKYFIPTPTMMFRKSVLDILNGYDPNLSYEDFDIWIRIARAHSIVYQDSVLMYSRVSDKSMSTTWYKKGDAQAYSTYLVCKKIQDLNKTTEEKDALIVRLKFELRQCFKGELKKEFQLNFVLLREIEGVSLMYWVMKIFL